MRIKLLLGLLLASVLFVSGCIEGFEGFESLFGGMGGTIEAPNDVLLVKDLIVIPRPPVPADSDFEFTFLIKNIGDVEEGAKDATNVNAYLFDWGRCNPKNAAYDDKGQVKAFVNQLTIYPGGAEIVEWKFQSPTNTELGRMEGTCPMRFKVQYNFDAFTTSDVTIISDTRLRQAARAGETITVSPVQTHSRGPIKIDLDFQVDQPVKQGITIPLTIIVEDKGSGLYQEIPIGALEITFPSQLKPKCYTWMENKGGNVWANYIPIQLIRGKTPPIRCDIDSSKENTGLEIIDMRTFNVRAKMHYTYNLYEEVGVKIYPTYEGEEGFGEGGVVTTTTVEPEATTTTIEEEQTTTTSSTTTTIFECPGDTVDGGYIYGTCAGNCFGNDHIYSSSEGNCYWDYKGHRYNSGTNPNTGEPWGESCIWNHYISCDSAEKCTDSGCTG